MEGFPHRLDESSCQVLVSFVGAHTQSHVKLKCAEFLETLHLDCSSVMVAIEFHQLSFLFNFALISLDLVQGDCSSLDLVFPQGDFTATLVNEVLGQRGRFIQLMDD